MQTKTLEALLIEANDLVKRLSYDESVDLINNTQTVIIDVREESEVYNLGLIKNAVHIPRGLLEFKLSPNSPNEESEKLDHLSQVVSKCLMQLPEERPKNCKTIMKHYDGCYV